jgi:hypothetical protein
VFLKEEGSAMPDHLVLITALGVIILCAICFGAGILLERLSWQDLVQRKLIRRDGAIMNYLDDMDLKAKGL